MLSTARPPSKHRTQAERSAETRDKVINAAIACIAEDGFKQATTMRIARRAGVTWGAIQHQFGDKDSILRAVMERGMEEFRAELVGVDIRTSTLEERVGEFTRRGWTYFRRPAFRAFLAIVLNMRSSSEADRFKKESIQYLGELWRMLFSDLDIAPQKHVTAQRFSMAVLIGMAIELNLTPELDDFSREVGMLDEALLNLLSPSLRG